MLTHFAIFPFCWESGVVPGNFFLFGVVLEGRVALAAWHSLWGLVWGLLFVLVNFGGGGGMLVLLVVCFVGVLVVCRRCCCYYCCCWV